MLSSLLFISATDSLRANLPASVLSYRYIDDTILVNHCYKDQVVDTVDLVRNAVNTVEDDMKIAGMKLNVDKTKWIIFNAGRASVDLSCVTVPLVDSVKLLGYHLDSRLTFDDHVAKKTKTAKRTLWSLRTLRSSRVAEHHMTRSYKAFIRPILEFGLMPLAELLREKQWNTLESVQRLATLIVCFARLSYEERLNRLKMEPLRTRIVNALHKFAKKAMSSDWGKRWLTPTSPSRPSTRNRPLYPIPSRRTVRCTKCPRDAIIRILNDLPRPQA